MWGTRAYWPGGLRRISATRGQAIFSCGVVLKGRSPASASPNARNIVLRHVHMLEIFLCCQCLHLTISSFICCLVSLVGLKVGAINVCLLLAS